MVYTLRNSSNTDGLLELIKELEPSTIMAEIGCYTGESSLMFIQSGKVRMLYCIDPFTSNYDTTDTVSESDFKEVEKLFDINTHNLPVTKMKMCFTDAFNELPELDFIYIDGDHRYEAVKNDIKLAFKKVKKGGIIAGHDYCNECEGVIRAVNEFFGKPNKIYSDSSWMVRL